jgi:uncharacterized damage-inducible protein DinB
MNIVETSLAIAEIPRVGSGWEDRPYRRTGSRWRCRAVAVKLSRMTSQHVVGYDGMWAAPESDPRVLGSSPVGELATIREYLTNYRHTLDMKCEGLTPQQLATRSVPPSTMSLLGLVRHMAKVEHGWFQRELQGRIDEPRPYWSADSDLDFDGATADPAETAEAFRVWKEQIAYADQWLDTAGDLGATVVMVRGEQASVRDILIHMVEEYARHCGHADLLRECVDGRTGQ